MSSEIKRDILLIILSVVIFTIILIIIVYTTIPKYATLIISLFAVSSGLCAIVLSIIGIVSK